jgi:hypothetical protein
MLHAHLVLATEGLGGMIRGQKRQPYRESGLVHRP